MNQYIGIDLGTTNSVIASFDGKDTRVWKSPEQNDVTPSAIYVDKHGHRFFGRRAYEMAPADDKNAVVLFKRHLGTNVKYTIENTGETLTPEESGAEILRLLIGYLPKEWQENKKVVITVPAAFNQVKKDATMKAAELARLGNVALMQEPVAAVMSVMKRQPIDGIFLIYDLGGGTFDISVAEHAGNHVNLLAQGGKEMCGGRDWDRLLWREVVYPWLRQNYHLPQDADRSMEYRRLRQLALFACEQGKVELSFREEAYIQMDESVIGQKDLDGKDIYLDVAITRSQLTGRIQDLMQTTLMVTAETIQKAGIRREDIRKIVFIGGPTVYPPLQEYVMNRLGIREKGDSNPMTAVAEGAAIYAESIDWNSHLHTRQEKYRQASKKDYEIKYERRVSADRARIRLSHKANARFSAEIVSETDGWTSGRVALQGKGEVTVPLSAHGENLFRVRIFDEAGVPVPIFTDRLAIHRVLATVKAIPASQTIMLKALDRVGGRAVPVYLVRENEHLPKRGAITLYAGKRLVAGSNEALVFTLWEGDIVDPIEDNRYIGVYRIPGSSFSSGVIAVGAEILCEYEINEAGHLQLGVTVPSVGAVFASQNFYSSTEGTTDLSDPSSYVSAADRLAAKIAQYGMRAFSTELRSVSMALGRIKEGLRSEDPEQVQLSVNELLECQRELAKYRLAHIKEVRVEELNRYRRIVDMYQGEISPENQEMLDQLYDSARRAIDHEEDAYDTILHQYRVQSWAALMQIGAFLRQQFEARVSSSSKYTDQVKFSQLKAEGQACIENEDYQKLRLIIHQLDQIEKPEIADTSDHMYDDVNVVKG